jgi:hypothetical protein
MKETFSLIPQVFYDLIGRVLPGAATILGALIILADVSLLDAIDLLIARQVTITSVAILVAAWLFVSYLVGALLGAIAFAIFKDNRKERSFKKKFKDLLAVMGFSLTEDAECCRKLETIKAIEPVGRDIDELSLPYAYDFILLRHAGAGGRLAKLRAEIHMCRVLMLACGILGTAYVIQRFSLNETPGFWPTLPTLLSLGAIARASYLLDVHLVVRARRLVVNCWDILKQEDARTAATDKPIAGRLPPVQPAPEHSLGT